MEYTDEIVNDLIQKEADRRVNQALENKKKEFAETLESALKEERRKVELEISEKAKLSADELAQKELEDKILNLQEREKELAKRTNNLTAKEMLSGAGIPKDKYEKLLGVLVTEDENLTKENVNGFISVFNETKSEIENNIKLQLSKIPSPTVPTGEQGVTKDGFNKMGYAEKLKLKSENPELFKQFMTN